MTEYEINQASNQNLKESLIERAKLLAIRCKEIYAAQGLDLDKIMEERYERRN